MHNILCLSSTLTKKCWILNSNTKFCNYTIMGVAKGAVGPWSSIFTANHFANFAKRSYHLYCTRLWILLNTLCRKPGFNSLRTPLNHGAEQASNETLKQTQQRNWSNASQGGQTALKEHFAVLHSETASTTQQPRGEHRGTIKDCKIAGTTTWQGQGNHTFTTNTVRQARRL